MWSREPGAFVGPRPLVFAAVLLAGCTSEPKAVHLQTAPTLAEWRAAAAAVAADISTALEEQKGSSPVSLLPIQNGNAPPELDDVLLAELVLAGVPMAAESESSATLRCRVFSTNATVPPRGMVATGADVVAETVLLCLYAEDKRYLAASRKSLSLPPTRQSAPRGIVLEITR